MSVEMSVRGRVDPAPLTAAAAAGDLVCIGLFVGVGSTVGHSIGHPVRIAITFSTFALGWGVVSLLAGVHAAETHRSLRATAGRTVLAWVVGAALVQGLRWTDPVPGNPALAFYLVSVGVGLALLVPWRLGVTALARRA
jgi:zinc transporter ZupT